MLPDSSGANSPTTLLGLRRPVWLFGGRRPPRDERAQFKWLPAATLELRSMMMAIVMIWRITRAGRRERGSLPSHAKQPKFGAAIDGRR